MKEFPEIEHIIIIGDDLEYRDVKEYKVFLGVSIANFPKIYRQQIRDRVNYYSKFVLDSTTEKISILFYNLDDA